MTESKIIQNKVPPGKNNNPMKDLGLERAVIGTVIKNGPDSLIEIQDILDVTDFALPLNRYIFSSLKKLADDNSDGGFDIESLKLKMKSLGYGDFISGKKELEYIELLSKSTFSKENLQTFALQLKKLAITRELYKSYNDAIGYLEQTTGQETISEILQNAEQYVTKYIYGLESQESISSIADFIEAYIQEKLEQEVVDQVGIPTGYPIWDNAIGGGARNSAIAIIGARPKVCKSFDAINKGLNIAKLGVPVLYLDTELTKQYQTDRMVCAMSGCPLYLFETNKFKDDKQLVSDVVEAGRVIANIPFYYQSINGMSPDEALSIARKWVAKYVGFNNQGKANPCVIIYDYLKLATGEQLSKYNPEFLLLGLLITRIHQFAVKYDLPVISYVQLNREGIDSDDTSIVAGSDRILWLCSSLSFLRNKDENDLAMGCGFDYGNKKIIVSETRYGSGLEKDGDYINLHASLRPGVGQLKGCGAIREGLLFSETKSGAVQQPNQQRNSE